MKQNLSGHCQKSKTGKRSTRTFTYKRR